MVVCLSSLEVVDWLSPRTRRTSVRIAAHVQRTRRCQEGTATDYRWIGPQEGCNVSPSILYMPHVCYLWYLLHCLTVFKNVIVLNCSGGVSMNVIGCWHTLGIYKSALYCIVTCLIKILYDRNVAFFMEPSWTTFGMPLPRWKDNLKKMGCPCNTQTHCGSSNAGNALWSRSLQWGFWMDNNPLKPSCSKKGCLKMGFLKTR